MLSAKGQIGDLNMCSPKFYIQSLADHCGVALEIIAEDKGFFRTNILFRVSGEESNFRRFWTIFKRNE